ncbi:MAG: hypothetical protein QOG55_761 [Acidobacteriaceae bacterium]|nr:hypothetical protein [Acidobacteriaceae bacterium]
MESFEVFPIVSFRGMSTGVSNFWPEIDQRVTKTAANCARPIFSSAREGLEQPVSKVTQLDHPLLSMESRQRPLTLL